MKLEPKHVQQSLTYFINALRNVLDLPPIPYGSGGIRHQQRQRRLRAP
jgi:hypothetical protein